VDGIPKRLIENSGIAYIGCYVLGMGFVLDPSEAQEWIAADARNAEVLFPYLNGEDLNSRPDTSASRWVIDFNDRDEAQAATYAFPYARSAELVKPERMQNKRKPRRDYWWQFAERATGMRKAIAELPEVLVIALVSKTVMPVRVPTEQVFSHKLGVFGTDSYADQAVLSSAAHQLWVVKYTSTMRADINYSPSDVFETFPRPAATNGLEVVGRSLNDERREILVRRGLGLTKLYNLVNDAELNSSADSDIARIRAMHAELDCAVLDAYGWSDVDPGHGFHTFRKMQRWTVSPETRVKLLDRLLEENQRRAAQQPQSGVRDADGVPSVGDDGLLFA
jgi:hypothetical protein